MALDLGQHGSASITVSGFFAVTSNTVQVGGDARLHAGGSGIALDASVSVKALFVFSPFSLRGDDRREREDLVPRVRAERSPERAAGGAVAVAHPGRGMREHRVLGRVPRVQRDVRGRRARRGCRSWIPWVGRRPAADTLEVVGLLAALQDAGNWSGVAPAGTAAVVSRAQGSEALVDPVGGLQVHQKAVPLETEQRDQPVRSGEGDDADHLQAGEGDAGDGRDVADADDAVAGERLLRAGAVLPDGRREEAVGGRVSSSSSRVTCSARTTATCARAATRGVTLNYHDVHHRGRRNDQRRAAVRHGDERAGDGVRTSGARWRWAG